MNFLLKNKLLGILWSDLDSIDARIKELSELGKRNAERALATEYGNIAPKEEKEMK